MTLFAVALTSQTFAGEIGWAKDLASAQKAAAKSKKIMMIDFYTDWCGWCKRLDHDTYTNEKVVKLSTQLVSLKLNAEKEGKELATKLGVRGYPTIVFMDSSGKVVHKISGYLKPEPFAAEMTKVIESASGYSKAFKTLKNKPNDGQANAIAAVAYANRGEIEKAEAAVEKAETARYDGPEYAEACNALGDHYQFANQIDKAMGFFAKAEQAAKTDEDRAYAKMSLMICHHTKGDVETAKKLAKEILAIKGASQEEIERAKHILGE